MEIYQDLLLEVIENGSDRDGRNGMTRSIFGRELRFNLQQGFPAVTIKKLNFESVKAELLGFLRGYSHAEQFQQLGTNVWNANAEAWDRDGDLGRHYGLQWRQWTSKYAPIDQIRMLIKELTYDPLSRRHIVTAWNPAEIRDTALPPCHILQQYYSDKGLLSLQVYQRSADLFLGVPFNIASYALLLSMVAHVTGHEPFELILVFGDAHIYHTHFEKVKEVLKRSPMFPPKLSINMFVTDIDEFDMEHLTLENYRHHDPVYAEMVV